MLTGLAFLHPARLHLLWAVAALVALVALLERRGAGRLAALVSPVMQAQLATGPSAARRRARLALLALAMILSVLAVARPQAERPAPEVTQVPSADVMLVLDVSRSMLAEDAAPSRLGRAKAELRELLDELAGHRVGLIAFAGRASVLCPLTTDHGYLRLVLDGVSTQSVPRGGTRIGDALRRAVESLGAQPGSAKVVVLVTDGEDHDSFPLDAAREARTAKVHVVSIGFGDEKGSEIRLTDPKTGARTVLADRSGQVVRSRLDGETLRKIALETEGAYVPAGVAALDVRAIAAEHLLPLVRGAKASTVRMVRAERYVPFLAAALLALCGVAWASRPSPRGRR